MKKNTKATKKKKWMPTHLHIGILTIKVEEVAGLQVWGQYGEHPEPVIQVSQQAEEMLPTTLLHEMLHAASAAYELNLTERQVRCLDQLIPMMLRQNPELAKRLLG
jgi:hypothetical protein